jgi:hypothetical protein
MFWTSKSWIWIRIRKTGYGLFFILITPTLLLQRYEGDICPVITYVTIVTLWTAVTCFNILQRWGRLARYKCCGSGILCFFDPWTWIRDMFFRFPN